MFDIAVRAACEIGQAEAVAIVSEAWMRKIEEPDNPDAFEHAKAEAMSESLEGKPGTYESAMVIIETRQAKIMCHARIDAGPPRTLGQWDSFDASDMTGPRFGHFLSRAEA